MDAGLLKDIIGALNSAPLAMLAVILAFAVFAAFKGWWVPGYIYREKCAELGRQTDITEKAVDISERLTRRYDNGRSLAHD